MHSCVWEHMYMCGCVYEGHQMTSAVFLSDVQLVLDDLELNNQAKLGGQ